MKIKKFIVKDMNEALKLIREDLGPDAVIISNYRLPRKSLFDFFTPRPLEVTAALDDNKYTGGARTRRLPEGSGQQAEKLLSMLKKFDTNGVRRSLFQEGREAYGYLSGNGGRSQPGGGRPEVPFDIILKNEGNYHINREINQQWKKILTGLEIHENIVESLVNGLYETLGDQEEASDIFDAYVITIKGKVARLLEPAYKPRQQHRICTFVGPSGVGKTVTLAKLATHYKVYDKKKVVLISASQNGQRPGNTETLKYYGGLIDAPVECATNRGELVRLVDKHSDKDMVFIDTAGVNWRNTGMMLSLHNLLQPLGSGQEIFLVMSSATKGADLIKTADEYRKIGYTRFIFTKLDETDTCGSILNVVCRVGVPVAFVTYGQNVPDDIAAVNPKKLAGLLLGGVDQYVEQSFQI
ncbi:MAG: hypothetical protein K6T65_04210 [Peptococcaceae bacterium]|nr:hypothetical protein [Peptococcaceae bacterium]